MVDGKRGGGKGGKKYALNKDASDTLETAQQIRRHGA